MNRSKIINFIINKFDYKKYLEIGCSRDGNFKKINIEKVGVDPVKGGTIRKTSDEFFKDNQDNFDIIFIDGLHYAEQVYRDIVNSLSILNDNGTIVVHDCNPLSYSSQVVPKPRWPRDWNGNVWKGWLRLRCENKELEMFVVNADNGCGIIRRGKQDLINKWDIKYEEFEKEKNKLLNIFSVEEFMNYFKQI